MSPPRELRTTGASWQRRHLELCWRRECDIDPLILRARWLRRCQAAVLALSIDQELRPLF